MSIKPIRTAYIPSLVRSLNNAKKYVFDFFVIFISITSSFMLTECQRDSLHRVETVTALKAVGQDLKIDTTNYNKIVDKLREVEPVLLEAMNGQVANDDLDKIKAILLALRAYHGIGVQKYGYQYLSHNIRNPKIHVPGLLHWIGLYHELSGHEGNFGGFNRDYYDITFDNHKKLFETFPNYLHPDTNIANQAIKDGIDEFLSSRYWLARIGLTYRQITSYNIPVYIHNKQLSIKIIKMIDKEIRYN